MTEKLSHDVNVMLFKRVTQLSKLLGVGGGGWVGSYLNQKMFLHCADAMRCLIYSSYLKCSS